MKIYPLVHESGFFHFDLKEGGREFCSSPLQTEAYINYAELLIYPGSYAGFAFFKAAKQFILRARLSRELHLIFVEDAG